MPAYPDLSGATGALSMGAPPLAGAGPGGQQMPPMGMGAPPMAPPPQAPPARPGNSSLINRVLNLIRQDQPQPPMVDVGDQLRHLSELGLGGPGGGGQGRLPMQNDSMGGDPMQLIQQLLGGSGGAMSHMSRPGMAGVMPQFHLAHGGAPYVPDDGMGDGRSDHVEARLSPGEFVMDAETTSLLGNGNSEAGARKLEELRQNIRRQKGKALARGKFSPDAKRAESYLPRGALS